MPAPPLILVTVEQPPYPVETTMVVPGMVGMPVAQTSVMRSALFAVRDWLGSLLRPRRVVPRVSL